VRKKAEFHNVADLVHKTESGI